MKTKIVNELKNRGIWDESLVENEDKSTKSDNPIYRLSEDVINRLNDRIADEYHAHFLYKNAANWCQDKNYIKAANFFNADSLTELEHATTIQKYMTDFNVLPTFKKSETMFKFTSLKDIIKQAYDFELYLMKKYNEDSQKVFTNDLTTFDFLQQFRIIQKESVIEFNDLLNGLELVDVNNKLDVLYFEQTYF